MILLSAGSTSFGSLTEQHYMQFEGIGKENIRFGFKKMSPHGLRRQRQPPKFRNPID
jgi:hypothetical protein